MLNLEGDSDRQQVLELCMLCCLQIGLANERQGAVSSLGVPCDEESVDGLKSHISDVHVDVYHREVCHR